MKCAGDRCQFKHDENKKGTGKREHDGSETLVNQVTKKLKDELKVAINEIKKSKESKQKENEATDWKSLLAGIYMINLKQKDKTIKIHKFDKLEDKNNDKEWRHWVGIDTDAAMSVFGAKQDFAWIEYGSALSRSIELEGFGGGLTNPEGSGPAAPVVSAFQADGSNECQVSLYDPNALYTKGRKARILNANKLADLGCPMKQNHWRKGHIPDWVPIYDGSKRTCHVLLSEKDGTIIPLYLYRSILCARTFNVNVPKLKLSEGTKAILRGEAGTKGFLKNHDTQSMQSINTTMSEEAFGLDEITPEADEVCTEVEEYISNQKESIQSREAECTDIERAKEGRAKIMSLTSRSAPAACEFDPLLKELDDRGLATPTERAINNLQAAEIAMSNQEDLGEWIYQPKEPRLVKSIYDGEGSKRVWQVLAHKGTTSASALLLQLHTDSTGNNKCMRVKMKCGINEVKYNGDLPDFWCLANWRKITEPSVRQLYQVLFAQKIDGARMARQTINTVKAVHVNDARLGNECGGRINYHDGSDSCREAEAIIQAHGALEQASPKTYRQLMITGESKAMERHKCYPLREVGRWPTGRFGTFPSESRAIDADKYNAIANAAQVQMETTEETPIEIQSRKDMRGQLKRHGLFNYANLNTQEKGWLWHHIFGCMPHARLRKMQRNGTYMGVEVGARLEGDCATCAAARFRVQPHQRVPRHLRPKVPPFHTLDADGVSGFKVLTINKNVAAFVYYARGIGKRFVKLYQKKSQFPTLTERVIIEINMLGFNVYKLVFDNAGENISDKMLSLSEKYSILLAPVSPYTPDEDHYAEKTVGDLCRLQRAFMHCARGKMGRSTWGLALLYAAEVDAVIDKNELDGRSVVERITGYAPSMLTNPLYCYGAEVQWKLQPEDRYAKQDGMCGEAYFAGIENRVSIICKAKDSNEVFKISRRKCKISQWDYAKPTPMLPPNHGLDDVTPMALPSVLTYRHLPEGEKDAFEVQDPNKNSNAGAANVPERDDTPMYVDEPSSVRENGKQKGKGKKRKEESCTIPEEEIPSSSIDKDAIIETAEIDSSGRKRSKRVRNANQKKQEREIEEQGEKAKRPVSRRYDRHWEIYTTVKDNETPRLIASKFGMTAAEIIDCNDGMEPPLMQGSRLRTGTELYIPARRVEVDRIMIMSEIVENAYKKRHFEKNNSALEEVPIYELNKKTRMLLPDPENILFALVADDWKDNIAAGRVEMDSWKEKGVYEEVDYDTRDVNATIVGIRDLWTKKSDNNGNWTRNKLRTIAQGFNCEEGKDFDTAYAPNIAAESTRCLAALSVGIGQEPWQADVATAYLNSINPKLIYAYRPVLMDILYMDAKDLLKLRLELLQLSRKEIKARYAALRKAGKKKLWRLVKSVYGLPGSGAQWAATLADWLVNELKMKRNRIDESVYTIDDPKETFFVGVYTDDVVWNGSPERKQWFKEKLEKKFNVTFGGKWNSFTGVEIDCNMDEGYIEFTQSKLIKKYERKYAEFLPPKPYRFPAMPLPEGAQMDDEVTDKDFEEAKHLPYIGIICSLGFLAHMSKITLKTAHSVAARKMQKWSKNDFKMAIRMLLWCIGTQERGCIWSCRNSTGIPMNVMQAWADADLGSHSSRKTRCGKLIMMNGGPIIAGSTLRNINYATIIAELEGFHYTAVDVMGLRNFFSEMGFPMVQPTVIFTDNYGVTRILEGHMSLGSVNKHVELKYLKSKEWKSEGKLSGSYCNTNSQLSDLFTKNLSPSKFNLLGDQITGYAYFQGTVTEKLFIVTIEG